MLMPFRHVVLDGVANGVSTMEGFSQDPNVAPYIDLIYAYLQARSEGALGRGRPMPASHAGAVTTHGLRSAVKGSPAENCALVALRSAAAGQARSGPRRAGEPRELVHAVAPFGRGCDALSIAARREVGQKIKC